jgi:hypothetical protein
MSRISHSWNAPARLLVRSFARFLSRLFPNCRHVMYKEYPYAPCRTQHHGYDDGRMV